MNTDIALEKAEKHWNENADVCDRRADLMRSFKLRAETEVERNRWQEREDDQRARSKTFRQLALDVAASISSPGAEQLSQETLAFRLFEPAQRAMDIAQNDLQETISIFEEAANSCKEALLIGKLHRAINGMRNNPEWFYFTSLNAPDLMTPAAVINGNAGMSGLDWPEDFRPQVWEAHRILNRWRSAIQVLKYAYGRLSEEDRLKYPDLFLF